jgi:hypothetical protein
MAITSATWPVSDATSWVTTPTVVSFRADIGTGSSLISYDGNISPYITGDNNIKFYASSDLAPQQPELKNLGLRAGPGKPLLNLDVKRHSGGTVEAIARLDGVPDVDPTEAFVEVNGKEILPIQIGFATERKPGVGPEMLLSRVLRVMFSPEKTWFRPTAAQLLRYKIQRQLLMGSQFPKRFLNLVKSGDPEARARSLLRDVAGDVVCNSYLRRGFLAVRGRSGLVYKIITDRAIRVLAPLVGGGYEEYETICIIFKNQSLPPTDAVVMKVMMVLHDEVELRKIGNVTALNRDKQFLLSPLAQTVVSTTKPKIQGEAIYTIGNARDYVWNAWRSA